MHIATNIRYLRKQAGLTQEELSKKIEKTSITISDYEKGKSTPPIEVATKFCEIFNVDLNQLVTKNIEKENWLKERALSSPEAGVADINELETLRRINLLQEQRLAELEREIRERAPELARRLGL